MVDANICKLLMERYPDADPDKTVEEIVDPAEMVEIVREAEAMAEASMKSVIEQGSREVYRRLVSASEPQRGSNDSHRIAL